VGDEYGSSLYLSNREGTDRVYLSPGSRTSTGDISPGFIISEENGKNLISGRLGTDTRIVVGHATEESSLILSAQGERPSVRIAGPEGKQIWRAP